MAFHQPESHAINGFGQSSPKIPKVHQNDDVSSTPPFLCVKKLSDKIVLPSRASPLSAGYDLFSAVETKVPAGGKALVATDIIIAIPKGTYGFVAPRSIGKHPIHVGTRVIDADYRGPVSFTLFNCSDVDFEVKVGDKFAQLIIQKIQTPNPTQVHDLDKTFRGDSGFGSTGINPKPQPEPHNTNGSCQSWPRIPKFHQIDDVSPIPPFLHVKKLSDKAVLPFRASPLSAGCYLSSAVETKVPARGKALVATDISIAIPDRTYARVAPVSRLTWKHSIDVGAGVVDADYRGSVGVVLYNYSDVDFEVKVGDRIAQLIIEKIQIPNPTEGIMAQPQPESDAISSTPPFLHVEKLSDKAVLPSRGSPLSAGYDLSSVVETKVPARGKALVATDISIAIPEGTYGRVAPRSGLAWKHSIGVDDEVINADYRGPVGVILRNNSDVDFEVKVGDRIAQLIIQEIVTPNVTQIDDLDEIVVGLDPRGFDDEIVDP